MIECINLQNSKQVESFRINNYFLPRKFAPIFQSRLIELPEVDPTKIEGDNVERYGDFRKLKIPIF